ncbi:MAG: hypothetical protein GY940_38215 [bacterium]|nr:hypothetical protein [bacterium]
MAKKMKLKLDVIKVKSFVIGLEQSEKQKIVAGQAEQNEALLGAYGKNATHYGGDTPCPIDLSQNFCASDPGYPGCGGNW